MSMNKIKITGAHEHNLKNVTFAIPKHQLVIFSGVSGSGKSSLAFNTIYAEGRRRYIESLSSYARQFLGGSEKPLVEKIDGLAPAIAIDQKSRSHNPRSTVGTVTEIYDYLRLLYARIGVPYCVNHKIPISSVSIKEIVQDIAKNVDNGDRIMILSPLVREKKGSYKELFTRLIKNNFLRVRVDGNIYSLDEDIKLNKNERHNIDIVIDRIIYQSSEEVQSRLHDAIEVALEYGQKLVRVLFQATNQEMLFSSTYACKLCGFKILNLEPRLFSFNAPMGACELCKGLGVNLEIDVNLLMPDKHLTILEGGIRFFKNHVNTLNIDWQKFYLLLKHYNVRTNVAVGDLTPNEIAIIIRGSKERVPIKITTAGGKVLTDFNFIEGVGTLIERRFADTPSEKNRLYYRSYLLEKVCHLCNGARLNSSALAVYINNRNISNFCELPVAVALNEILQLNLSSSQKQIAHLVVDEIFNRLNFLQEVGLGYLTLARSAKTLSGGESQRIRLATQIGSHLTGVVYVLDEPSIGLHQKDNDRLLKTLFKLRDLGNTVIVVEHDEETINRADWVVDIGPMAGHEGGEIVYNGKRSSFENCTASLTSDYVYKRKSIDIPKHRRSGNGQVLEVERAAENNLKNINVKFPLGKLIALTGVSGSGKSTLLQEILWKSLRKNINGINIKVGKHKSIKGLHNIDRVINISQDPIGKTPRSIPATYTSVFDDIRDLFALSPESKARGFTKSRFSFNVPGGRCEHCQGAGIIKINMQFLPDVHIECEVCSGRRYNDETLLVKFKNKNIFQILDMTFNEAGDFFSKQAHIANKIAVVKDVGLGYLKLGQPSTQLSGGESQRVKLSTFLLKKTTGHTLFILDEPTTGLHPFDIDKLIKVLNKIVNQGNTVILIEHNLDVIKVADYIIDLGPEGGDAGGRIVCSGTPEQVAKNKISYTGEYLRVALKM